MSQRKLDPEPSESEMSEQEQADQEAVNQEPAEQEPSPSESSPEFTEAEVAELVQNDENGDLFEHLTEDFQELMSNRPLLRTCIGNFIDNTIDELTLGIIFDLHRKFKTKAYCLEVQGSGDEEETKTDLFQQTNAKKNQECVCPNCDRSVAASRFAPHLEGCMGIRTGRASRNASRRVASNKDKGEPSTSYGGIPSDDDDDVDWNSSERKRNRKKDKNGGKKNRGTPKKNLEVAEPCEPLSVDIEGDDEELSNIRENTNVQERRSNSASPAAAEGVSGPSTTPKKRDKSKKKSKTKDRGSPSME